MSTADPYGAQAHARAMAGTTVQAMPTVPAPDGFIWEETLAAGGYAGKRLDRGARLRLTDLEGEACVSMLVFSAERPVERLNVADTVKVQWNAYLGAGRLLLSDMGKVLMSITQDEAGTHDAFCGALGVRERLVLGAAKFGLGRKDVHPCVNWFKGVRIGPDGETVLDAGPFAPGRSLTLRAEMDVIVVLANGPHVLDPRGIAGPVRLTAWRGPVTPKDDPIRNATPEGLRAFLNVEEDLAR